MEIFKEEFEGSNLMFTDEFKNSNISIAEFLNNPKYYKIMWRSNAQICLKIDKCDDEYYAFACVLDSINGKWIVLSRGVGETLYDSLINLNGLKDAKKINEKCADELEYYFETNEVYSVTFLNSEKKNKISSNVSFVKGVKVNVEEIYGITDKMVEEFNINKRIK